ncbi:pal [Symbiodinium microadriaticum]|nr:pal [Symbiodinium microadriaticum]
MGFYMTRIRSLDQPPHRPMGIWTDTHRRPAIITIISLKKGTGAIGPGKGILRSRITGNRQFMKCFYTRQRVGTVDGFYPAIDYHQIVWGQKPVSLSNHSNVLIVDDEPDIADNIAEYLIRKNYQVDIARDGLEALEKLRALPQQERATMIVVTDLRMPKLDGLSLLHEIRQALEGGEQICFIMITGHGGADDADKARDLGAFDFIEKPISLRNLEQIIAEATDSFGGYSSYNTMTRSSISAFQQGLATGYAKAAENEDDEWDFVDAQAFQAKADDARSGVTPEPYIASEWQILSKYIPELDDARARLIDARDRGADRVTPGPLARAQVFYDCWVQEIEEMIQPEDVRKCKQAYMVAMTEVRWEEPEPEPEPLPEPPVKPMVDNRQPESFSIYFDFNSTALDSAAFRAIKDAAVFAIEENATAVVILGHTDRAGTTDYNDKLARSRAEVVAAGLLAEGVPEDVIELTSFGENRPAVGTADEVRERSNRRAEIIVYFN